MSTNLFIRRAVRCALLSGAATALTGLLPAHAQQQQQQETRSIQEVVVTGSRIAQPNLTSVSPVTSVGSDQIKIEGVTRAEDLINNLPQAFADFGGNLSNGATGAATVNLRSLGSQRTLVLVNSRRLMPGDPTQNGASSPDLNQIPAALIERVEVLTGGASAVYGADAVAGVVNFIMNDKFEGVRVDAPVQPLPAQQRQRSSANIVRDSGFNAPDSNVRDGYSKDITFLAGINTEDGRGNATVYFGYRAARARSRRINATSAPARWRSGDTFGCAGSGTTAPACSRLQPERSERREPDRRVRRRHRPARPRVHGRPICSTSRRTNYYQRPDERKTAGLFAHYDFSDKASVYTEFMFMDDRTQAQIAAERRVPRQRPRRSRRSSAATAMNCDNPLPRRPAWSTHAAAAMPTRATSCSTSAGATSKAAAGSTTCATLRSVASSACAAISPTGWNYDVYGLYGTSMLSENFQNDFSRTRLGKALNAVVDRPGRPAPSAASTRTPTCRTTIPLACRTNIFGIGGVTPDQLAYLQVPGLTKARRSSRS